ncbi:adenosylcobinamide-phosphate synthase CbiB [Sphingomonas sp. BIUV-7]|uniref:Cobalamin biosynthesis protein CobD n=1 Tax=Sphingomonas natans TaxID=3063330 RepID=A0ABT8Y4U0_9SPHN|nr:adenosylcobinamide-phosphate synthase CbiB [Sphingomonas sp. BIUV-7]MDO6413335.1 adenosylcobinamide-phosphate synthase CbiB [Sphingomonas sp. BIUV-7]
MADPIALTALALDATIGWPNALYVRIGHPVGAFARLIDKAEWRWNRATTPAATRRASGILLLLILVALAAAGGWAIERVAHAFVGRWAWIVIAIAAWPGLAQRSLFDHVRAVARPLASGDLVEARRKLARIVGRDTETLDEAGIARAAIESLAESVCDGVIAPLFWLLLLGLPGLWAFKAISTADSLIGHKEMRWRAFGWAAARTDDLANWIPARLSGLLLCLAAPGGWRTMARDHAAHASPNGGWPESAMAGALGIALGGGATYDGVMHPKPWINAEGRTASSPDLANALRIYVRACALAWVIVGGFAWAL